MLHSHGIKLSRFSDKDKYDTEGLVQLMGFANVNGLEEGVRVEILFRQLRQIKGKHLMLNVWMVY